MRMSHKLLFVGAMGFVPHGALAAGDWGISTIVESCQAKAVGPCEEFRGRANQTNGSGATVIWKVGTKRIVAIGAATDAANSVMKDKLDFHHKLFATFKGCPMEKDIPGHRTEYCVEEIKNARWEKIEE